MIVNATVRRTQAMKTQAWRYDNWVDTIERQIDRAATMGQTAVIWQQCNWPMDDMWLHRALNDFTRAGFKVYTTTNESKTCYTSVSFEW